MTPYDFSMGLVLPIAILLQILMAYAFNRLYSKIKGLIPKRDTTLPYLESANDIRKRRQRERSERTIATHSRLTAQGTVTKK
jgi:hypothetical protein